MAELIRERPERIPYLDVLTHLHASDGVLVIGSTRAHYTPSKVFQAIASGRPVFALLHCESTAVSALHGAGAGEVVAFEGKSGPDSERVERALVTYLQGVRARRYQCDPAALDAVSARESARALAEAMNGALEHTDRAR